MTSLEKNVAMNTDIPRLSATGAKSAEQGTLVHVEGLLPGMSEAEIRSIYSQFGPVSNVILKEGGNGKALVEFCDNKSAILAVDTLHNKRQSTRCTIHRDEKVVGRSVGRDDVLARSEISDSEEGRLSKKRRAEPEELRLGAQLKRRTTMGVCAVKGEPIIGDTSVVEGECGLMGVEHRVDGGIAGGKRVVIAETLVGGGVEALEMRMRANEMRCQAETPHIGHGASFKYSNANLDTPGNLFPTRPVLGARVRLIKRARLDEDDQWVAADWYDWKTHLYHTMGWMKKNDAARTTIETLSPKHEVYGTIVSVRAIRVESFAFPGEFLTLGYRFKIDWESSMACSLRD
ncbi:hypothetical protein BJ508DRAFT_337039 [Ascobolus immersus RN42]|uniref:RRM domain-containing protein n=1 Tax=Ascobolus immersus RN42 TaxID=1160509 RepID=A0A3N4H6I4_ASCIM|nr:hypothetical protein BJ508DRAFT_337039 [Ascobolus immersus RN42]